MSKYLLDLYLVAQGGRDAFMLILTEYMTEHEDNSGPILDGCIELAKSLGLSWYKEQFSCVFARDVIIDEYKKVVETDDGAEIEKMRAKILGFSEPLSDSGRKYDKVCVDIYVDLFGYQPAQITWIANMEKPSPELIKYVEAYVARIKNAMKDLEDESKHEAKVTHNIEIIVGYMGMHHAITNSDFDYLNENIDEIDSLWFDNYFEKAGPIRERFMNAVAKKDRSAGATLARSSRMQFFADLFKVTVIDDLYDTTRIRMGFEYGFDGMSILHNLLDKWATLIDDRFDFITIEEAMSAFEELYSAIRLRSNLT